MNYIVICQQVVGGGERQFDISYNFDHEYFVSKEAAVKHGFKIRGSDDFNIGVVERGKLKKFMWMDEDLTDADELIEIARQIGLK